MESIDVSHLAQFLGVALNHQVTQFSIAFTLAAFIHAQQVKKEIKLQMTGITEALNSVATALRQDLAAQIKRIGNIEDGVAKLAVRVDAIEKK